MPETKRLTQETTHLGQLSNSNRADNIHTLVDLLSFRAQTEPNKTIYTFLQDGETPQDSWSHAEVERKARAIAAKLQAAGALNQRVLLLYPSGLDFIASYFGCLYAGAIAVPLYPPRKNRLDQRIVAVARDAQAKFVLTSQKIAGAAAGSSTESWLESLEWIATDEIDLDLAETWVKPDLSSDSLAFLQYTSGSTGIPKGVMVSHGNLLHNSKLIQRCFESRPADHGVMWTPFYHDMGLIGGVIQPLFSGLCVTLMSPVDFLQKPFRWLQAISTHRGTISGGPNFAYELCIDRITPEQQAALDLSSWSVAFTGAEPVRPQTLERFAEKFAPNGFRFDAFLPCLGMAEATLFVTGTPKAETPIIKQFDSAALTNNLAQVVSDSTDSTGANSSDAVEAAEDAPWSQPGAQNSQALVSCGRTYVDLAYAIVHPENLRLCKDGEVGEIWVSGPSVAQGYWQRPGDTAETFGAFLADSDFNKYTNHMAGPYLRTGDLGFSLDDELFVTGRLKDLIIIHGQNRYPQDIEYTVEASHDGLRAGCTAAFSIEQANEERLVIIQEVERQALRLPDFDEIVAAIRNAVSHEHQLQVASIQLIKPGRIPKTSSGKIQRRLSKQMYLQNQFEPVAAWEMSSASTDSTGTIDSHNESFDKRTSQGLQQWIAHQLSRKLGIKHVEVDFDKPFADYGIDSIAAVALVQELNEWLDGVVEIDPTTLWDFPTIESLVSYLSNQMEQVPLSQPESQGTLSGTQIPSSNSASADAHNALEELENRTSLEDELAHLESLLK